MGKKIDNLRWHPLWVSYFGCLKGCMEYWKRDISTGWLFGGTGYAFLMYICPKLAVCEPKALKHEVLAKLGENLGYRTFGVWGQKTDADLHEKQQLAWQRMRQAIDMGLPCFGWNLDPHFPGYSVINGYDKTGYYFSGPGTNEGVKPKRWQELGDDATGWLEVHWLERGDPAKDVQTVRDSFNTLLEHAQGLEKRVSLGYQTGLAGYDLWIQELEKGQASGEGVGINARIWSECRDHAVEFLVECKDRLDSHCTGLFDEAITHYRTVAANLAGLVGIFPTEPRKPWHLQDQARLDLALQCLRKARNAETCGLKTIEQIFHVL